jgi:hypothetical protein
LFTIKWHTHICQDTFCVVNVVVSFVISTWVHTMASWRVFGLHRCVATLSSVYPRLPLQRPTSSLHSTAESRTSLASVEAQIYIISTAKFLRSLISFRSHQSSAWTRKVTSSCSLQWRGAGLSDHKVAINTRRAAWLSIKLLTGYTLSFVKLPLSSAQLYNAHAIESAYSFATSTNLLL